MTGKEYILLSLALLSDCLDNLPNKSDVYRLRFNPYRPLKKSNHVMVMAKLLSEKAIERVEKDGQKFYRITTVGWQGIEELIPVSRLRQRWDGKWRVVIFDIEEKWKKDRDYLRGYLYDLGLAMLQESVWVTPFAIEASLTSFLQRQKIAGEVLVLRSEILSGKVSAIIRRAFKVGALETAYEKLMDAWEDGDVKGPKEAGKWEMGYFETLARDPLLPRQLLPRPWVGDTAKSIYYKFVRPLLA